MNTVATFGSTLIGADLNSFYFSFLFSYIFLLILLKSILLQNSVSCLKMLNNILNIFPVSCFNILKN